jgi:cyanobactin maturation PatA/PatG family protease
LVNKPAASGIIWTVVQDLNPIYAVQPGAQFGTSTYDRLVEFFEDQVNGRADLVAVAGRLVGRTKLLNGQVVPVLCPDIRGMYNWSVEEVIEAAIAAIGGASGLDLDTIKAEIKGFVERAYYDYRNLGVTAQERALNYAATNLFQAASAYAEAIKYTASEETKLDSIDVERSPICREGSDCWDVKITFFNPKRRYEEAKRVFRFTVDVSGVIPVTVGLMRSWYVY